MPENANKKISVFCDAHIPRNRGLNIKFLHVQKSIIRRLVKTSYFVTVHIGTSIDLREIGIGQLLKKMCLECCPCKQARVKKTLRKSQI